MPFRPSLLLSVLLAVGCLFALPACAQSSADSGKLKIHVVPKQAYVFVDGKAIRDGSQTIALSAGNHKVGVYNYGYLPNKQDVQITAGQTKHLDVTLQRSGDKIAGPFADIELKGHPRAAVLLNGDTPDYFVGHVDEFDNNFIWHQWLLVKPGTYQVTVTRKGNTIWSGPVTVKEGQRAVVYLNHNGKIKTKMFSAGLTMKPQPRFDAGIASAMVPVAPVIAQLSAQATNLSCGAPTTLNWSSTDAVDTSISGIGEVAKQGDRSVTPTHETTYVLTAKGPGGESTQKVTVDVNTQPTANITVSTPEVRYHKIGDKVVEQGSATLNWSASNANSVKVEPLNADSMSGNQTIKADPNQTTTGPVNQDETYTLTATNACGGSVTKTATLHIVGSIDPPPSVTIASIFYPTAYPTRRHPQVGLVASEKASLADAAQQFKSFSTYEPNANLVVVGYADVRGPVKYNQALSARRAELAKSFLISKGVPADKIQIEAKGKSQQIDIKQVKADQAKDQQKPEKWMLQRTKTTWMAYNRRADIVLNPQGIESAVLYPNDIKSARVLWQRPIPNLKEVIKLSNEAPTSMALAHTGGL